MSLEAYEEVTGEALEVIDGGERPDFIAVRPGGEQVGIELTQPHHDYELAKWDKVLRIVRPMNDLYLLGDIHSIIAQKAVKRASADWRLPTNTILVVQLNDYSFLFQQSFAHECLAENYQDYGFAEIWLPDHTELDAFGAVRLIGLYPESIWGLHHQASFLQKPYG
jgi:hypothetical protein